MQGAFEPSNKGLNFCELLGWSVKAQLNTQFETTGKQSAARALNYFCSGCDRFFFPLLYCSWHLQFLSLDLVIRSQSFGLKSFDEHAGDDEHDVQDGHASTKELAQLPPAQHDAHHSSKDHAQEETSVEHEVWRPWCWLFNTYLATSWLLS